MKENDVKVLAMYLPQYHEVEENSQAFGEKGSLIGCL